MRIESIWQFPVKSMQGGTVPNARLTADGIVGDRTWATRDEVRGGIRGAKQLGGLMRFAAESGVGVTLRVAQDDEAGLAWSQKLGFWTYRTWAMYRR